MDTGSTSNSGPLRLDSWKEIAGYLRRDVRTVQRWEKEEGLPVHRLQHGKLGSVYAHPAELDAWWNSRRREFTEREASVGPADRHSPRFLGVLLSVAATAAVLVGLWNRAAPDSHRPPGLLRLAVTLPEGA